jgi:hypothetical protein
MVMHKRLTLAVASMLFVAACNQDPTAVSSNELALAQSAQNIADNVVGSPTASDTGTDDREGLRGTTSEGWFRRLIDTLRTTNNATALADLAQARAYRDSAFMAREAGDTAKARSYRRLAFRSVLSAVIVLFPDAPARTAAAADTAIARIEKFLGDKDAPRIRALLAHVDTLRHSADSALAAGDSVTALALNLRSIQILHRLVEHVRDEGEDHDDVADNEMESAEP